MFGFVHALNDYDICLLLHITTGDIIKNHPVKL